MLAGSKFRKDVSSHESSRTCIEMRLNNIVADVLQVLINLAVNCFSVLLKSVRVKSASYWLDFASYLFLYI